MSVLPREAPRFRRNVWALLAQCFCFYAGIGIQTLVLNLYLVGLGYREDFVGIFSLASSAALGIGSLLASRVSDRLGARRCLLLGTAVLAVASVGVATTAARLPLLSWSVLLGIGQALVFVPSPAYLLENAPADARARSFSAYYVAIGLATIAGSVGGGQVSALFAHAGLGGEAGYRWTLVAAGCLTALGFLPVVLADDQTVGDQRAAPISHDDPPRRLPAARIVACTAGANALMATSSAFMFPFLAVFFAGRLGAPTDAIGMVFALGAVGVVLASAATPVVSRRLGPVRCIAFFRALCIPFTLGMGLIPIFPVAGLAYVARSFLMSLTWPVEQGFNVDLLGPAWRARLSGVRWASWYAGTGLGSALAGAMIVRWDYPVVFVGAAALAAIHSLVYYVAFRPYQADPSPGQPHTRGAHVN